MLSQFISYLFLNMTFTKGFYTLIASLLVAENSFAALDFDKAGGASTLRGGSGTTAAEDILQLVQNFLGFVTLIAVLYVVYAGFQVLTAGGDEEKLKKGKAIIIQVVIGVTIMWLAYSIVTWIMTAFGGASV